MDYGNSIIIIRDYGKVTFNFNKVMEEKNISRYQLSKMTGIRFEVIDRFYKGNIERLDVDVLSRILFALNCSVEDVISYENRR